MLNQVVVDNFLEDVVLRAVIGRRQRRKTPSPQCTGPSQVARKRWCTFDQVLSVYSADPIVPFDGEPSPITSNDLAWSNRQKHQLSFSRGMRMCQHRVTRVEDLLSVTHLLDKSTLVALLRPVYLKSDFRKAVL